MHFKNVANAHLYWRATSDRINEEDPAKHTRVHEDNQCQERKKNYNRHGFRETKLT